MCCDITVRPRVSCLFGVQDIKQQLEADFSAQLNEKEELIATLQRKLAARPSAVTQGDPLGVSVIRTFVCYRVGIVNV